MERQSEVKRERKREREREREREKERENTGNNSGPSERVCTSRELARRQARGGNEVAGSIILVVM